ncbi:hypothetical protein MAPG_07898 [Magnaporthiopsis poae ATCC 64411]|uniref:Uncharacterized protein n=1 Tax=Magnaporthiopsis poae (strain ATCC 64411 / 73-15) TaxID=644358 RepID=A0A0C4E5X0_MAGP6|nr:hypothetical protein MAPG_07898 [Magnaporthiopsis poae ATCC 64411]
MANITRPAIPMACWMLGMDEAANNIKAKLFPVHGTAEQYHVYVLFFTIRRHPCYAQHDTAAAPYSQSMLPNEASDFQSSVCNQYHAFPTYLPNAMIGPCGHPPSTRSPPPSQCPAAPAASS